MTERSDVLVVELNEFNTELLKSACQQNDLPALSKVLTFLESSYRTNDRYNSGYLEPWVQWVSIHSGVPSTTHYIKHLGDVPSLKTEQCWETLSKNNITTGVWGVMNGEKRTAHNALFFLPDPWTFTESGTPKELNNLLDLPRYLSKNYQNLNKLFILKKAAKLFKFIFSSKIAFKILHEGIKLLSYIKQYGKKHFVFISCFDYLSTLLFIQYKKKFKPRCTFLFLNSLAHLQHHHWKAGAQSVTPEILFGLRYIDRIFAELFKAFPDDNYVVHNGLSQMNTNHEKPWVLYRQKDPFAFLKALNIPAIKVEQLMTHDGHAFFSTPQECYDAFMMLKNARLNNKTLFQVEINPSERTKLFYMLKYTDKLDPTESVTFSCNGQQYPFFDYFDAIVTRTGRHVPMGTVFSQKIVFPDQIYNHDFNVYLYHYLLPEIFPLREEIEEKILIDEYIEEYSEESELV